MPYKSDAQRKAIFANKKYPTTKNHGDKWIQALVISRTKESVDNVGNKRQVNELKKEIKDDYRKKKIPVGFYNKMIKQLNEKKFKRRV